MGFDAINALIERNNAQDTPNTFQEQELPLPPGHDTGGWREVENLRLRQEGAYLRLYHRGGSAALPDALPASLGGDLLLCQAFETQTGRGVYRFLIIHTALGGVSYYNLDTQTRTDIITGATPATRFSQTVPITPIVNGRFVYLFDRDTQRNRVWNIETGTLSDWNGQYPTDIFGAATTGFDEKPGADNVFGFKEGQSVISIPQKAELVTVFWAFRNGYVFTDTNRWVLFVQDDNREDLELSDGTIIDETKWFYKPVGIGIKSADRLGSDSIVPIAERPEIKLLKMRLDGEDNFITANESQTIDKVFAPRTALLGDLFEQAGQYHYILKENGSNVQPYSITGDPASFTFARTIVPNTLDTRRLLDMPGKYKLINEAPWIEENTEWDVKLARAYAIIHVAEDGSVSLPGPVGVVTATPFELYESKLDKVFFQISDPTFLGGGAGLAYRYLISTRWHLGEEAALEPSTERNPNGTWYIHTKLENKFYSFYDTKDDAMLQRPIIELLPYSGGIALQMAANTIYPNVVIAQQGSLILANYTLKRIKPEQDKTFKYWKDPSGTDIYELYVQYDYSNNSTSELADLGLFPARVEFTSPDQFYGFSFYGLDASVTGITIYIREQGETDYRRYKRIDQQSPHFNGARLALLVNSNNYTDFPAEAPGTTVEPEVQLSGYIATAIPFQQINIANQARNSDGAAITALLPMSFDSDKTLMRFRLMVQTSQNIQTGYLVEGRSGNQPVFEANFEVYQQAMGNPVGTGATRLGRNLFISGEHGLYVITIGANNQLYPRLILSRNRYAAAGFPLKRAIEHAREREYWFIFDTGEPAQEVFVCDVSALGGIPTGEEAASAVPFRRYLYDATASRARDISALHKELFIAIDGDVVEGDRPDLLEDSDRDGVLNTITGRLESAEIVPGTEQLQLHSLEAEGQAISLVPSIDLQTGRRWKQTNWQAAFQATVSLQALGLQMYGRYWSVMRQGIAPRIQFVSTPSSASGFIQQLRFRGRRLANSGKAKEQLLPPSSMLPGVPEG